MVLKNVYINGYPDLQTIHLHNGKITAIGPAEATTNVRKDDEVIVFENAFAFPGLINSHDHLDFNLFPRLGNRIYKNYLEWGADIHQHNKDSIRSILKIPRKLRIEWGIYKNLLNGITTVVHHGKSFKNSNSIINVFQNSYSLHSVGRESWWQYKLNKPFAKKQPFVIHVGEGTDNRSLEETNRLIRWNVFKRRLIAIHGVAMNRQQAKSFQALVWCPDSNFFLLGQTADISELKKETTIIFGTDATVSATWNIWEQVRLAQSSKQLTDDELFQSLTSLPASVWGLKDLGALKESKAGDIVVSRKKNRGSIPENFFLLNPEDILLIICNHQIILFDETLFAQLRASINQKEFSIIAINNDYKYVKGNLAFLMQEIKKYNSDIKFPVEV